MIYSEFLAKSKKKYVTRMLWECQGNQCAAAESAGIHRNTFKRLMVEVGIAMTEVREIRRQCVAYRRANPNATPHHINRINRSEAQWPATH